MMNGTYFLRTNRDKMDKTETGRTLRRTPLHGAARLLDNQHHQIQDEAVRRGGLFFANSKSGAMWEILRTFAASKQTGTKKPGFITSI